MAIKILNLLKSLIKKPFVSLKRFPISVVCIFITSIIFIYLNHSNNEDENIARVQLVLILTSVILLGVDIFFERFPNKLIRIVSNVSVVAIMILYYFFILTKLESTKMINYSGMMIIFIFLFVIIPYFLNRTGIELYVINILTRVFITYFYTLIIYLGICSLILTINLLFGTVFKSTIYLDILILDIGIFSFMFFLADIPKYEDESELSYPKALKVLVMYILVPIIYIYSVILYVYFIKIIVTGVWPEGIVSNLVLWSMLVAYIILFLLYSLRDESKWIEMYFLIFPKISLPLFTMMFISISIRIRAYGITESRYFVVLLGIWITLVMLYYSVGKRKNNVLAFVVLMIFTLISTIGPLSCYNVTNYSQNIRLKYYLEKNKMLVSNKIVKNSNISLNDKKEISGIVNHFQDREMLKEMKYVEKGFKDDDFKNVFGFEKEVEYIRNETTYFNKYSKDNNTQKVKGFDYYFSLNSNQELEIDDYKISLYENSLKVYKEKELLYQKDMIPSIEKILDNNTEDVLSKEHASIIDENDNIKYEIKIKNINGEKKDGKIEITNFGFDLILKIK